MAVHGLELDQVGCAAGAVWWKLVRFDSPLAFPSQHFQTPFKRPATPDYHVTPSDYPSKQHDLFCRFMPCDSAGGKYKIRYVRFQGFNPRVLNYRGVSLLLSTKVFFLNIGTQNGQCDKNLFSKVGVK